MNLDDWRLWVLLILVVPYLALSLVYEVRRRHFGRWSSSIHMLNGGERYRFRVRDPQDVIVAAAILKLIPSSSHTFIVEGEIFRRLSKDRPNIEVTYCERQDTYKVQLV